MAKYFNVFKLTLSIKLQDIQNQASYDCSQQKLILKEIFFLESWVLQLQV